jgi:hypothetical protein
MVSAFCRLRFVFIGALALVFTIHARTSFADKVPPEWNAWLWSVVDMKPPIPTTVLQSSKEARAMDAWLATESGAKLRSFEAAVREVLFFPADQVNVEGRMEGRSQWAKALFSLSSSSRFESLAAAFLFGDISGNRGNLLIRPAFNNQGFISFFLHSPHWRKARFWNGAISNLILNPPIFLDEDPVFKTLRREGELRDTQV